MAGGRDIKRLYEKAGEAQRAAFADSQAKADRQRTRAERRQKKPSERRREIAERMTSETFQVEGHKMKYERGENMMRKRRGENKDRGPKFATDEARQLAEQYSVSLQDWEPSDPAQGFSVEDIEQIRGE